MPIWLSTLEHMDLSFSLRAMISSGYHQLN